MLLRWTRSSAKRWQQFKGKGVKNDKVFHLMGPYQRESFLGKTVNWELFHQSAYCRIAQRAGSNAIFSYIMVWEVTWMIFSVAREESQIGC